MSESEDNHILGRSLRPRGPAQLNISVTERPGETVLQVSGELDVLTRSRLAPCLDEIVRRRTGNLVLDLRQADFIDSVALFLLLKARRRLVGQGRGFSVICGQGPVLRAIELARLTETLGVLPPSNTDTDTGADTASRGSPSAT